MDQDSTNGSGSDKRNWRERLGIGAKEMPKLSDEFRDEAQKAQSGGEAARPVPRAAQPVTSPAPMAPRAPKAAPSASPTSSAATSAPPPRATPRSPDNAAQEALAEKLRAQRAAAEKLAEQRVQAARDRAEGRVSQPEPAPRAAPSAPRTPPGGGIAAKPRAPIPPASGGRPKFSFAEESAPTGRLTSDAARPGLAGAPLTPPRPALGTDRGQPPFLRPSAPGLGARTQPPYKPVDPASPAGYGPPPRLQPPPTGRPSYGGDTAAPGFPAGRNAPRRPPPALESYPRPETREYPEGEQDDARQVPRLGRPAPRGRAARDELDEVFEDDGGSRQRASARDYQSAYGEADAFAEDTRRSSGPWLLLLAILAAAMLAGGGWWYYNNFMKNVASTGAATGEVPVVNAPPEPAKVAPEVPAATGEEPAAKKKQIYDRIVGEQEVTGEQLQQTEETPVPPATAEPVSDVPAATGTNPIPAPDAPLQGTDSQGLPTVDEPPPLPLPPAGGEQGSLDNKSVERIAAASAQPEQGATAPPTVPLPEPTITSSTSSSDSLLPPPPEKATDGAALVSDTATSSAAAADPAQDAQSDTAAEQPAPPPPKKKQQQAAAPKKKQQQAAAKDLGAEPVVLVPPAKQVTAETETAASTPITAPAEAPSAAPEKKKRTIMDLFRGEGASDADATAPAGTQVASVEPQAPPATAKKQAAAPPAAGSGFVIQLASFRTESDARKEYSRLSAAYPSVVGGLQEQIKPTSVGGSTRYQLGLGPLPSRSEATKVCSALITAGESDCIVRGR